MAQMERNVNLEEIDSDALFGIDALKGQSILQKIIFFTSVVYTCIVTRTIWVVSVALWAFFMINSYFQAYYYPNCS